MEPITLSIKIQKAIIVTNETFAKYSLTALEHLINNGISIYNQYGYIPDANLKENEMEAIGALLMYNLVTDGPEFKSADLIVR